MCLRIGGSVPASTVLAVLPSLKEYEFLNITTVVRRSRAEINKAR